MEDSRTCVAQILVHQKNLCWLTEVRGSWFSALCLINTTDVINPTRLLVLRGLDLVLFGSVPVPRCPPGPLGSRMIVSGDVAH